MISGRSKVKIVVKLQLEAVHLWRDCNLPEVDYLKNLHRHTFFIRIEKEVNHNDRDIEIIIFKRGVIDYLNTMYYDKKYDCLNFDSMSCEMIAELIYDRFKCSMVEVLEDNENGAMVC